MAGDKTVFVTVGTTRFDGLIRAVCSAPVASALAAHGFRRVMMQIGAGEFEPPGTVDGVPGVALSHFRFKSTLRDDVEGADLVISHAGAGSILEALGCGRALVVVVNEGLMNNHQVELAQRLAHDGHLIYATCSTLAERIAGARFAALRPFECGDAAPFATLLDSEMGY